MWWRSSNRGVSVTCSLVGYRWLTMPIKNCISSRLSTGNWYWIRYDLIAAMMKSYHLDQQISNLSSLPSRARSLSTLPACKAPGNAMEKSWKSASLTAQPNFHRKKQNIMFHFPCWNKTTQIKIKIKKTSRCESTTPPHRTRVPQRSVAFRPFRKKKKNMDLTATAATSGIAPEHLGHQPGPKGQQKTSKGWFWGTTLLDEVGFFQCWKEKGWSFWDDFFFLDDFLLLRMIFESYLFERFGSFWMIFFWKGWISKAGRPPWEVVVSW